MIQRLLSPLSILQIRKVTLNCGAMAASAVRLKSSGGQKPAVGVAAVVLRKSSADRLNPEVLMIQRGKEPKKDSSMQGTGRFRAVGLNLERQWHSVQSAN
eukprot:TRINITY_DN10176_c0_g1_i1.p3 TRINITY_DN10176_c0_g1~~TRINITY_DN10176_c0_g1_i1.p3  ORF type:complete len:100 (+),score=15.41 TRINITY_DN10176_c0_g1_i1:169-468(+)